MVNPSRLWNEKGSMAARPIVGQVLAVGKQEAGRAGGTVKEVGAGRAVVDDEADHPPPPLVVPALNVHLAGTDGPNGGEGLRHVGIEDDVLEAVTFKPDDLRLVGRGVQHDVSDVVVGILGDHLLLSGGEVEPDQAAGIGAPGRHQVQAGAIPRYRERAAGQGVLVVEGLDHPPVLLPGGPVFSGGDAQLVPAAIRRGPHGGAISRSSSAIHALPQGDPKPGLARSSSSWPVSRSRR